MVEEDKRGLGINMEQVKLTKKQRAVLDFIKVHIGKNKQAPYIREIQQACGIISYKSAIDKLLALEKKGCIKRALNKHRSIKLI
jgi:SOS-response transcriptional repressor LexA